MCRPTNETTMCRAMGYLTPGIINYCTYDATVEFRCLDVRVFSWEAPFEDMPVLTYKQIVRCEMSVPDFVSPEARDIVNPVSQYSMRRTTNTNALAFGR